VGSVLNVTSSTDSKMMWLNHQEENHLPHGNKGSSATIWVDVTTIKCSMLLKWLTESQHMIEPLHPPAPIWHHSKRAFIIEIQNQGEDGKQPSFVFLLPKFWLMIQHVSQNNAIKPISMICYDNQGFPLVLNIPSSLFTAGKKFNLKPITSNCIDTISGSSLQFSPGVVPPGYLHYPMKNENNRFEKYLTNYGHTMTAAELWQENSGNTKWHIVCGNSCFLRVYDYSWLIFFAVMSSSHSEMVKSQTCKSREYYPTEKGTLPNEAISE